MQFISFIAILEQNGAWGQKQAIGKSKGLEGRPGGQGDERTTLPKHKDPLASLSRLNIWYQVQWKLQAVGQQKQ